MGPPKKRKAESPNGSSPGNDREDEERHIPPREPNESSAEYLLRCFSPQGHLLYEFRHYCGYCKEYFLNGKLYSNHFRSKDHIKNQAAYEKEHKGANVRGIHSLARQWGRVEKQARKELQKYFEDLHKKLKVMTQWTWCNENISLEFLFQEDESTSKPFERCRPNVSDKRPKSTGRREGLRSCSAQARSAAELQSFVENVDEIANRGKCMWL